MLTCSNNVSMPVLAFSLFSLDTKHRQYLPIMHQCAETKTMIWQEEDTKNKPNQAERTSEMIHPQQEVTH